FAVELEVFGALAVMRALVGDGVGEFVVRCIGADFDPACAQRLETVAVHLLSMTVFLEAEDEAKNRQACEEAADGHPIAAHGLSFPCAGGASLWGAGLMPARESWEGRGGRHGPPQHNHQSAARF